MNNNITYIDKNIKIETIYKIEYIDNKKDFKILEADKHPAPWELYKVIKFDSLQDAITCFLFKYADEQIFDVRLFEEILVNGETIREQCINDIVNFSRITDLETQRIKKNIEEKQYIYNDAIKQNEMYRKFIKKYNADKEFEKFKEEKEAI